MDSNADFLKKESFDNLIIWSNWSRNSWQVQRDWLDASTPIHFGREYKGEAVGRGIGTGREREREREKVTVVQKVDPIERISSWLKSALGQQWNTVKQEPRLCLSLVGWLVDWWIWPLLFYLIRVIRVLWRFFLLAASQGWINTCVDVWSIVEPTIAHMPCPLDATDRRSLINSASNRSCQSLALMKNSWLRSLG